MLELATPAAEAADITNAKKSKKLGDGPSVLAFRRSSNAGHFAMYSINSEADRPARTALLVREEPLRGMNGTSKTIAEGKAEQAVLQVVESCELAPGDDTLVVAGKVLFNNALLSPQSCNARTYPAKHHAVIQSAIDKGIVKDLALRYAMTIASGNWGWRNALESNSIVVEVNWTSDGVNNAVRFKDLILSNVVTFDINRPEYAENRDDLLALASAIEAALTRTSGYGTRLSVTGFFDMGLGARVYPSQEWASELMKAQSKKTWNSEKGVTRVLAKLTKNGLSQAILNDRKVGNAIRTIDTWYDTDAKGSPIAVEPFGGNSHQGVAFRTDGSKSMFGLVKSVHEDHVLTDAQISFYVAATVRGGVYGG